MTIPEAVQLVLQAAALGRGGEVFALDMGEPVRIVDLAADLIRLSGLEVGTDIEIQFTGIRPGERLNEEVFFQGEDVVPTSHPKILQSRNGRPPRDLIPRVDVLIDAARKSKGDQQVRPVLRWVVPEFRPENNGGHSPDPDSFGQEARFEHDAPDQRRMSEDRRMGLDRRSGIGSRHRLVRSRREDRRTGRDRRCGIDRRTGLPMELLPQAAAV
jgi:hypothetical protein